MTDKLVDFHSQLKDISEKLEALKKKHPDLFLEVLSDGEDVRMVDAFYAISKAEELMAITVEHLQEPEVMI